MSRFLNRFWGPNQYPAGETDGDTDCNGALQQPTTGAASWIEINDPPAGGKGEPVMTVDQATMDGVLMPLGNQEPVNLIAIFGAARGGKSFLMNQLAGRDDVFKISNEKASLPWLTRLACWKPRTQVCSRCDYRS